MTGKKQSYAFQAEVSRVLGLVINSLYSNKEIFLRELVSNASDAIDKRRFEAISDERLAAKDDAELAIRITPDEEAGTLTISDDGIGMSREELVANLGTIAHSGATAFMEQLAAKKGDAGAGDDVSLIGQFGVGFYSAYLVADRVDVVTLAAGEGAELLRWSSDATESFTIEAVDADSDNGGLRKTPGTDVILHLKDDQKSLLAEHELRRLVTRYSDFVAHPIELAVTRTPPKPEVEEGEDIDASPLEPVTTYEQVNSRNALWRRRPSDLDDDQYNEFYKHLTHDWEPPMARRHFHVEGTQMFSGLLYIPKRPPFELFSPETKHGVRLHVKRVFIMDDCEELLPKWLRFVRGVIDSEDLPLNVSRELLQDSRVVKTIRKQVVKRCLDMIEDLAKGQVPQEAAEGEATDDAEEKAKPVNDTYIEFWSKYGAVLKEGLHFDPAQKDRIAKLVRYESTGTEGGGLTSLQEYVDRMPEGQEAIYYVVGASRATVENAPHLESLKAKGYEVLLMTDAVDQWAVESLQEFDGKKLVSAMDADLDLGDAVPGEAEKEDLDALVKRVRVVLQDQVSEVRLTSRLTDSPACLVMPSGGLPPYMERLLRMQNPDMPQQKRVLELNPAHGIVTGLRDLLQREPESDQAREWIELVYDQALLAEGSPVEDPARMVQRMNTLLQQAVTQA